MGVERKWISLNVGGTNFLTSRATLNKSTPQNSPLHRISNNSTNVEWDRDETGAYMIDRDPLYFQIVINFLRHGRLLMSRDLLEEGVLLEAEYFNLPELAKAVKQRIQQRRMIVAKGFPHQQANDLLYDPIDTSPIGQVQAPYSQVQGYVLPDYNPQQRIKFGPNSLIESANQQARAGSSSLSSSHLTLNPLIDKQDYITNYVNNVLADEINI